jgi:hypothetical protein
LINSLYAAATPRHHRYDRPHLLGGLLVSFEETHRRAGATDCPSPNRTTNNNATSIHCLTQHDETEHHRSVDGIKHCHGGIEIRRRVEDRIRHRRIQPRRLERKVNRTFDIKVYEGLIEGKKLENVKAAIEKRKVSTRYTLKGTILETIVIETTITGDTAVAISCERNDLQVWEGQGTPEKSDDVLADGSLLVEALRNELQRRGDSWVITRTTDADGNCSAVF